MSFGKVEIIGLIILVIVLLFVGAKKLPELARGIGQSANELKKGFRGDESPIGTTKPDDESTKKS